MPSKSKNWSKCGEKVSPAGSYAHGLQDVSVCLCELNLSVNVREHEELGLDKLISSHVFAAQHVVAGIRPYYHTDDVRIATRIAASYPASEGAITGESLLVQSNGCNGGGTVVLHVALRCGSGERRKASAYPRLTVGPACGTVGRARDTERRHGSSTETFTLLGAGSGGH